MNVQSIDPILVIPFYNNDDFVTVRYRSKNYLWTKEQVLKVLDFFANLSTDGIQY